VSAVHAGAREFDVEAVDSERLLFNGCEGSEASKIVATSIWATVQAHLFISGRPSPPFERPKDARAVLSRGT
jgi:hypothetical protein